MICVLKKTEVFHVEIVNALWIIAMGGREWKTEYIVAVRS